MERDAPRGYTLIEVMMALTILAIGGAGIFALQSVAVVGNRDANDLTAATNLARGWVDALKVDALRWNSFGPTPPSDLAADTTLLAPLVAAAGNWTNLEAPPFSAGVDPQRADGAQAVNGKFCAEARARAPLLPLVPLPGAMPPVQGMEVGVRVRWRKAEGGAPNCAVPVGGDDLATVHWVYLSTMVVPNNLN